MTGETINEGVSEEVASMAPKLLSKPHTQPKDKSMAAPVLIKHPVFFYSFNMLTAELRADITKKWEACWPINTLRPLVLLDLISYLLFIKKIEEKQLITERRAETFLDNLIPAKERDELCWSRFKDLDAQSMHRLFTKERGIPDSIKNYSLTNLQYSLFLKEPLLLTPTANLLANIVDIIKIMEAEDNDTRAAIFEYLLNKTEITAQNGQVYAPDYVVKLMVALMQPTPEDVIGDPSTGNGSFLVNSAMYIAGKNSSIIPNFKNDLSGDIYKGIESDLVQLRIGAMNMILHGIEDPKLEVLNVFSKANLSLRKQPTLILSNLFFEGVENKTTPRPNTPQTDTRRQEILFLNLILKSLKSGGRVAVIIREIILYDNITEIKTIRQKIIDENKLEAVITLPGKAGSLFSGACILIFSNPAGITTDKVWFYKMEAAKEGINKNNADPIHTGKNDVFTFTGEYNDVPDILTRWKNEKEETGRRRTDKSFYVPVDEIRTNNYNLGFNEYRKIVKEADPHVRHEAPITAKKITNGTTALKPAGAAVTGAELPVQAPRFRKTRLIIFVSLIVICIAATAFYFMFYKNKNDNPVSTATKSIVPAVKITPDQSTPKVVTKTGMLSAEHIKATIKDTTTGITYFQKQADNPSPRATDASKAVVKSGNATLADKKPAATPEPVTSADALKVQYTVVDTTFFHDQPDESTSRQSYLDPLNKNILNPIQDRNGFIYIEYTNRFGRTSKGWINKKDLRPLK
ncbi:MAG: N-6 DNA methylase [Ginsengibacter sp.]